MMKITDHTNSILRISIAEPADVRYWCNKFNCTKIDLENAINRVGSNVTDVAGYLQTLRSRKFG